MFWNNLEIPKKRAVASFVGNFSPVKRRREILVRRIRHFRGDTGDVLNTRAIHERQPSILELSIDVNMGLLTLLEDRGAVDLDDRVFVFVLLVVGHDARVVAPLAERHKQMTNSNSK